VHQLPAHAFLAPLVNGLQQGHQAVILVVLEHTLLLVQQAVPFVQQGPTPVQPLRFVHHARPVPIPLLWVPSQLQHASNVWLACFRIQRVPLHVQGHVVQGPSPPLAPLLVRSVHLAPSRLLLRLRLAPRVVLDPFPLPLGSLFVPYVPQALARVLLALQALLLASHA
jgi:hypothetical protein